LILDQALKDIHVIDLTRLLPGPLCTRYLCDMGAKITKIEDTDKGDYTKFFPPLDENGIGVLYKNLNAGKKILNWDLKTEGGVKALKELVKKADVLIESFRPGVMESLGFDFESLKKLNPKIIMCSISGYGQNHENRNFPGHDLNYMGYSGLLSTLVANDEIPVPGFQMADIAGGSMMSTSAILGALHQVRHTGEGIHLDISMTHSLAPLLTVIKNQKESKAPGIITGESACYSVYRTKDQKFMALGAMEKKFWVEFCDRVEKKDWLDRHPGIGKEYQPLKSDLQKLIESKSQEEWIQLFKDGVACFSPVKDIEDSLLKDMDLLNFPL